MALVPPPMSSPSDMDSLPPGASDVLRGGRSDRRSFRNFGLAQCAVLLLLAWAVAVDDSGAYATPPWMPGLLVGAGLFGLLTWWWAIPWVHSSWVVEIGPDVVRWHGGWRRRDRVVRRARVVTAKPAKNLRFVQLGFHDASGERVGMLPLFQFPAGRVIAALRHHGWPVPALEDLVDQRSPWR